MSSKQKFSSKVFSQEIFFGAKEIQDCPPQAPYKKNWECFATDPTPPPDPARGDITLSDTVPACKGFTITNSAAGNKQFAYAVHGGGDFNGDKIPDIVISTYDYPSPSTVYVIYGKGTGYSNIDVNTLTSTDGFNPLPGNLSLKILIEEFFFVLNRKK